jgi:hypothetical protein
MNPARVRVERGRRRPPEGQSSALAGAETCRNRFQTRPPGTPFRLRIHRDILQPSPAALDLELPVTQGLREPEGRLMSRVSTNWLQDQVPPFRLNGQCFQRAIISTSGATAVFRLISGVDK